MNIYKLFLALLMLPLALTGEASESISSPVSIDSRIKTFVYSKNEIFPIVLNYGYHSYIEFSNGETVKSIAMGDSVNWKIKPSSNKLYIMPLEKRGITNMLIETNKGRSYAFDLISRTDEPQPNENDKKNPALQITDYNITRDITYIVRFYYPKTDEEFDFNEVELPEISPPSSVANDYSEISDLIEQNSSRYQYNYYAAQDSEDILPTELFDDGKLTYFKFAKIIPKIFVINEKGEEVSQEMLSFNNYIIINGVYKDISIRYKRKHIKVINNSL